MVLAGLPSLSQPLVPPPCLPLLPVQSSALAVVTRGHPCWPLVQSSQTPAASAQVAARPWAASASMGPDP